MSEERLVELVVGTVRELLGEAGVPIEQLGEHTRLSELSGFDSLAIVALIERLEGATGKEFEFSRILPETFETPATIAAALLAS